MTSDFGFYTYMHLHTCAHAHTYAHASTYVCTCNTHTQNSDGSLSCLAFLITACLLWYLLPLLCSWTTPVVFSSWGICTLSLLLPTCHFLCSILSQPSRLIFSFLRDVILDHSASFCSPPVSLSSLSFLLSLWYLPRCSVVFLYQDDMIWL